MKILSDTATPIDNPFTYHLKEFTFWMEFRGWSPRTIEPYLINIQHFLVYLQKQTDVNSFYNFSPGVLHQYQHYLYHIELKSGKALSLSSQHTKLVSIRSFLNYLYLNNWL
jgi:site-specific recombinase XerD